MQYVIYDTEASIALANSLDEFANTLLIMKHSVKRVGLVREDIIRIDISSNPLESIVFRHRDVIEPVLPTPSHLVFTINSYITNCVCCDCQPQNPL